jgi:hypothetical protein
LDTDLNHPNKNLNIISMDVIKHVRVLDSSADTSPNKIPKIAFSEFYLPCEIMHIIFSFEDALENIDKYSKVDTYWKHCVDDFRFPSIHFDLLNRFGMSYRDQILKKFEIQPDAMSHQNLLYYLSTCKGFHRVPLNTRIL